MSRAKIRIFSFLSARQSFTDFEFRVFKICGPVLPDVFR